MGKLNKIGLTVGVIGGIGLGLMLGSEYSAGVVTLLGADLAIISVVGILIIVGMSKNS